MDETLSTYHRVLSIVGIPFFAQKNWNSKPWLLFQIFNLIIGLLSFVMTTVFVVKSIPDLLLFIQCACIWTTGVLTTISLVVCFIFRNEFRNFLNEMAFKDSILEMPLIKLVLKMDRGSKLMELKKLVEESQRKLLKYSRLIIQTYVGIAITCATLYLSSPIYVIISKYDSSMRLLAFDMWFPWSLKDLRVYIASFLFHVYCAWLCCIAVPGLQSTILLLLGQLIRQLRILGFILLHLAELSKEITANDPERWQQCCKAVLTQCVQHYIELKKFSNKLNVICRPFYLTLILIATMLVCMCSVKIAISGLDTNRRGLVWGPTGNKLTMFFKQSISFRHSLYVLQSGPTTGFHLTEALSLKYTSLTMQLFSQNNKLSLDTMKYYVHWICFILVVLMFCLLGQQVQNECAFLEKAVIEKWYIFDKKHQKNVIIFFMALSQRMPIYIFGTTTLSLPTYTWFIRTGMSFFTLVMSVLEEAE